MEKATDILNYDEIARSIVRILKSERACSSQDGFDAWEEWERVADPRCGRPEPHRNARPHAPHPAQRKPPVVLLHDEHRRRQRVVLDPESLTDALEKRGLASAARALELAPAEVKVIAALLLETPIALPDAACPRHERVGFDNPLLVGSRFEGLAKRLAVDAERLRAELEGAPAEMLAIIMLIADDAESVASDDADGADADAGIEEA